jgi:transposase
MKQKKTYSENFKKDALQLLKTSGKNRSAIERDLGLSQGLPGQWEQRYQVNASSQELEGSEIEKLKAEVKRLQKENEVLKLEREILKKRCKSSPSQPSREISCD